MHEELIARLEAVTELTLELFLEVQATLRPDISDDDWARSYAMAIADAWESAALTLVPGEWLYSLGREEEDGFYFYPYGEGASDASHAATPALAICIAALRAKGGGA